MEIREFFKTNSWRRADLCSFDHEFRRKEQKTGEATQ